MWHKTFSDTEKFLDGLYENDLVKVLDNDSYDVDNLGTVMTRMIFHSWNHLGEIASVRQLIGKNPGNPGYGNGIGNISFLIIFTKKLV